LLDRARGWVQWVGPARVVASAVVVLAVVAGAYWLVKPPPVTTESKLPFAQSSSVPPATMAAQTATTVVPIAADEVVVHVAGAVLSPGVYTLVAASRVVDAVRAAGGLTADANADAINLAAVLADGQRVYVPRVGEAVPIVVATGTGTAASTAPTGPVNLNSATADELDGLPGVGPATAAAIIAHRDEQGPFAAVDDLADVRGIGSAKLEALRGLVTV